MKTNTFFQNIYTLSELKKQYRALALITHPDRGGSTEKMQELNEAFESLYKVLSANKETVKTATGYDNDCEGATAKEYTEHVYNEYNWKGERYNSTLDNADLVEIFRAWLKKTYPSCKFTVNRKGWNSINVHILKMDFNPFATEKILFRYDVNEYHVDTDKNLNDRAKDIVSNILSYINSYNYDASDSMTDYFDRGFYGRLEFGNSTTAFAVEIPKSRRTGGISDSEFVRPVGKAHANLRKVLGKAYFNILPLRGGEMCVLGQDHIYRDTEINFYPLTYSGRKTAEKRVEKLASAGIRCEIVGSYIVFLGYTEEVEKALAEEDREADAAEKLWNEQKNRESVSESVIVEPIAPITSDGLSIEIIDYSEKSIAVFGDTKQIKDQLKELGGRFNKFLAYEDGKRAGWVFPKSKRADIETLCHPIKKEESIVKDPIEEREQMNDSQYMAFVSCVKNRLLSAGYVAARKYIKEKVRRCTMRTDQLRYIAFLLSDFAQRYGETMKAKVA